MANTLENYQTWEALEKSIKNDPLYTAVIKAKTYQERERAVKTLSSIRGSTAVSLLMEYLKKKNFT